MITLSKYSSILCNSTKPSTAHFKQADMIVEHNWNNDISQKDCYIYDYFHDDDSQKKLNKGMKYLRDSNKTPISCKYMVSEFPTTTVDMTESIIQFRPSQNCCLNYFEESYYQKYGYEFPMGMYIDIPDEKGIYRRWIICAKDNDLQFISYHILPCNYYFHWVKNGKIRKMWGVAKIRNNYNSGIDTGSVTQRPDNQDQIWLPQNSISDELFYDDRIIVSSARSNPIVWQVSKISTIHPLGINKITIKQDKFNENTDYIPLTKETPFEMYANYNTSAITPTEEIHKVELTDYASIVCSLTVLKVNGGYRKFGVKFYNKENQELSTYNVKNNNWSFMINGKDLVKSGLIEVQPVNTENDYSLVKVKFLGDETYIGNIITCSVTDDTKQLSTSINVEVTSL